MSPWGHLASSMLEAHCLSTDLSHCTASLLQAMVTRYLQLLRESDIINKLK
jgi:hypothetical protein